MTHHGLHEQVRSSYANAAITATGFGQDPFATSNDSTGCCQSQAQVSGCSQGETKVEHFGPEPYPPKGQVPQDVVDALSGRDTPVAAAELQSGEMVLDLGKGGGIDVVLSARRAGPVEFEDGSVQFASDEVPRMHSAIVHPTRPTL